jgi:hypothetical protein
MDSTIDVSFLAASNAPAADSTVSQ